MADFETMVERLREYEFHALICGDRQVLKLTPEEALTALGVPELLAERDRLRKWSELALKDIDHAMLTLCNDSDEYGDLVHAHRNLLAGLNPEATPTNRHAPSTGSKCG